MPEDTGTVYLTPEAKARLDIDAQLRAAGWAVQDYRSINLSASRGVAVREFPLLAGHGRVDYLLYVDGSAVGVLEAKKTGLPLTGVETQSGRYVDGLPPQVPASRRPLPFSYESTGIETRFTSALDPVARSREVHTFHRPEHLARLLEQHALFERAEGPGTFSRGVRSLPAVDPTGLRAAQLRAIGSIEDSLTAGRRRALVQMAAGAGKTYTAASLTYRLLKHGGAKRILFLVDRGNLGRQALREFEAFRTPDGGRLFTELYNVQHLSSNTVGQASNVVITTIQRMYSILTGQPDLDPEAEEASLEDVSAPSAGDINYQAALPIEAFDVVIVDECHRSIYGVWRQVLEYFDAHLIGLTATPSAQTFGFFERNLVFAYSHEQAVAVKVNVDFDVYRIRTKIGEEGAVVKADGEVALDFRDRLTGATRQMVLEDDLAYSARELDRDVVAEDQLRTVIRTFRDKLFTEIFPGRREVPKTLVFAKDDDHADRIVQMFREEFDQSNAFAAKITYKTAKTTGVKPEDLLRSFRNELNPRVAVTVDMIATGTDIKPLGCVFFLRSVKSRNFFEQMKGRGVRVIGDDDFQQVTRDATTKTHFVIVDAVGVTETELNETTPLDRTAKSVSLSTLLQQASVGSTEPDLASTLGSRLMRLSRSLSPADAADIVTLAGKPLDALAGGLVEAVNPDVALAAANAERAAAGHDGEPTPDQIAAARSSLIQAAIAPIATNPELRNALQRVGSRRSDQVAIDSVSADELFEARHTTDPTARARRTVEDFKVFLEERRHDIEAIQAVYEVPYKRRVTFADVRRLAQEIARPPHQWTPEQLWEAYEALDASKVRGHGGRMRTDLVSLIRYTLERDNELVPYRSVVEERLAGWLLAQQQAGRTFTGEQVEWVHRIADIVATDLEVTLEALDDGEAQRHGGLGKAHTVFGNDLPQLLDELNQQLSA